MSSNLCLSTTATASGWSSNTGSPSNVPAYIKDDSITGTSYYMAVGMTWAYDATVDLGGYGVVTQVDLVHDFESAAGGAQAWWNVFINISSTWISVISGNATPFTITTVTTAGTWNNISAIRITASGNGVFIEPHTNIPSWHQCYELRLWGDSIVVPTVVSLSAGNIDKTLVTLNGSISDTGNASCSTRGFDWGTSTSYGNSIVESGTFGLGAFSASGSGLIPNYEYHYRAKAVNIAGTGYGSDVIFYTLSEDEVNKRMSRLVYDDMMDYMMEDY